MSIIADLAERLRSLLLRRREEAAFDEELRFHVERQMEENVRRGMDPKEARRQAHVKLGGVEQTKEAVRHARGTRWLEDLVQDLRYGARAVRRSPGFAAVVVLTLALGIGANTTVFSILNPYLLRDLPYGDPERLVQVGQVDPVTGWDAARFSLPQYEDWRARSEAFADMAAYHYGARNLTGDAGRPERAMVGIVTANLFAVLRAPPALGRTFTAADDDPGAEPVAVLGHGLWTRRYGADPGIVGRSIRLDGVEHRVVGVMPRRFNFPWNEVRLWVPMRADPASASRDATGHIIVGRLAPGWSPDRAREELEGIQRELGARYPDADGRYAGVTVRPLREALNFAWDVVRAGFILLLAAVAAVLLIACVNVASLTLARGSARAREIAVRRALGAGRARIVRQLLTENLLLAAAGGALGLLISYAAVRAVGPNLPEALYRVGTATIDARVLLFSLGLTFATPLVFGLTPAFSATRERLAEAFGGGGRGASAGRPALRARRSLVVAQVALSVVLIAAAGLMIRSFLAVQRVDLGFDADRLLAVEVSPPSNDYAGEERLAAYYDRAVRAIRALPGVRSAAAVNPIPLNHENWPIRFSPADAADAAPEAWPVALEARASPGYFEAMGIPVVAGRGFEPADAGDAAPVVVVSRRLADRRWPGANPVGRTLVLGAGDATVATTVVGVVGDVRHTALTGELRPHVYRPLAQAPTRRRFLVVAAAGREPGDLAPPVRRALAGIDANLPVAIRPMPEIVRESDFQWRVGSAALGAFGAAALLLAALGLYGIVAYSAARRRRELGIRVALGATARDIRALVVGEGLRLAALGVGIGIVLALAAGRALASQLFGVRPFDPVTLAAVLALFVAVAGAASLRPAVRAARLPPQDALRVD